MFRPMLFAGLLTASIASLHGQAGPKRPLITGISHMAIYAADPAASKKFYLGELGFAEGKPDADARERFYASPLQYVSVASLPAQHTSASRLEAVYFSTSNADALRRFLGAHAVSVPPRVERAADGSESFEVKDPEGNLIGFEQRGHGQAGPAPAHPTSSRIIHIGFVVHDRAAENAFYETLLGFRPYWHGGMKEGVDDWVSLQVPDGPDWLEYMLNNPADASQKRLGGANHFALGAVDINAAAKKLGEHGWHPSAQEHPQDGRDGKRQLNVFDPDFTRVEFMEFKPFREPCCSQFTASHPTP